jgi:ankyrin repeat protein
MASAEGHLDVVKLLLMSKANATESLFEGRTPLHEAAEAGYIDVCLALMSVGNANIHAEDKEGVTPLMVAAKQPDLLKVMSLCKPYLDAEPRLPPQAALAN